MWHSEGYTAEKSSNYDMTDLSMVKIYKTPMAMSCLNIFVNNIDYNYTPGKSLCEFLENKGMSYH